jgi:enamine deaminase RidA (YjgF/YER057c/UK114 family)
LRGAVSRVCAEDRHQTTGGQELIDRISTRTPWVDTYGYSRAVRAGTLIEVSGTTAIDPDGKPVAPGDAYQQSRYAFEIIGTALANLGASFADVVRTRVFLRNIEDWREFGRAHREIFGNAPPASSCVGGCDLLLPELLVEIEATAVLQSK